MGKDEESWPEVLKSMVNNLAENDLSLSAFGQSISYMEKGLIASKVIPLTTYYKYEDDIKNDAHMVLDSQALSNLNILEVEGPSQTNKDGSLYGLIDKCATKFGSRKLKKWI